MDYYIAVFLSRSEAIRFYEFLKNNGIYSKVIPTPKEAGKTCGLSVKINHYDFENVKFFLSRSRISSFLGWIYISKNGEMVFVQG